MLGNSKKNAPSISPLPVGEVHARWWLFLDGMFFPVVLTSKFADGSFLNSLPIGILKAREGFRS